MDVDMVAETNEALIRGGAVYLDGDGELRVCKAPAK